METLAQRAVRHVRCHIVKEADGLARVDERQDVRVREPGGDPDLAQEPLGAEGRGERGLEHFDGDFAAVLLVLGEVDGRHPTPPELALDGVAVGEGGAEACEGTHAVIYPGGRGPPPGAPASPRTPTTAPDSCHRATPGRRCGTGRPRRPESTGRRAATAAASHRAASGTRASPAASRPASAGSRLLPRSRSPV